MLKSAERTASGGQGRGLVQESFLDALKSQIGSASTELECQRNVGTSPNVAPFEGFKIMVSRLIWLSI